MPKVEHSRVKPIEADGVVLLVGGWAEIEVKSEICTRAAKIPKGKELSQLMASGCGPSGDLNVSQVVFLG